MTSRLFPVKSSISLLCVEAYFSFLYTISHVRAAVQTRLGRLFAADFSTGETRILRTFSEVPSGHIDDRLGCNLCKAAHLRLRRIVLCACGSTRTTSSRLVFAGCSGHDPP